MHAALGVVVLVAVVLIVPKFMDGPLGMIPGGPLKSGEVVAAPLADWSFAAAEETVELQLAAQNTSRTTWIVVESKRAFIPSASGMPPMKQWHLAAQADGAAWLRIAGKRYPVTLVHVAAEERQQAADAARSAKYAGEGPQGGYSYFAVRSRDI